MDNTKEYGLMCRLAHIVMGNRNTYPIWSIEDLQEMFLRKPHGEGYVVGDNYGSFTWLMEEALKWWKTFYHMKAIDEFAFAPNEYPDGREFWLRFVMYEKYLRHWNGKIWVKI